MIFKKVRIGRIQEIPDTHIVGNNNIGVTVCPILKPCSAYSIRPNSKTNIFHHERAFSGYIPENVLALRDKISKFKPDLIYLFNILGIGPVGILEGSCPV
jgi:hypothetical protein